MVPTSTRSGQSPPPPMKGSRPASGARTGLAGYRPRRESHGLRCCCGTTLNGNQVRLRLPPQAAPADGRPKGMDAPMLNRAKRAMRRGRSTPPRGHAGRPPDAPRLSMKRPGDPPVTALIQPSRRPEATPGRHDPSACRERRDDTHGRRTSNVLSCRHATSPGSGHTGYSTTNVTAQQGYWRSDGAPTLRIPIPKRMGSATTAPDGDAAAFPLVRACVEPPAGIEPATPSLPWIVGPFGGQRGTSLRSTELQVTGLINGREMGCCEAVRGAAAGKSLARSPVGCPVVAA